MTEALLRSPPVTDTSTDIHKIRGGGRRVSTDIHKIREGCRKPGGLCLQGIHFGAMWLRCYFSIHWFLNDQSFQCRIKTKERVTLNRNLTSAAQSAFLSSIFWKVQPGRCGCASRGIIQDKAGPPWTVPAKWFIAIQNILSRWISTQGCQGCFFPS